MSVSPDLFFDLFVQTDEDPNRNSCFGAEAGPA